MFFTTRMIINPLSNELFDLNFKFFEVVSRYRDTQLQVTENVHTYVSIIYQCFKGVKTYISEKVCYHFEDSGASKFNFSGR